MVSVAVVMAQLHRLHKDPRGVKFCTFWYGHGVAIV